MNQLRRGNGLKDVNFEARDTYETGDTWSEVGSVSSLESQGASGSPREGGRVPPPLPDRVLLVHSAAPVNTAAIAAAATLAAAAEPDHSGRIKDIPRPLVLIGGRSANVLGAVSSTTQSNQPPISTLPVQSGKSASQQNIPQQTAPAVEDDAVAFFAPDGKLGRLARLIAEARALESIVALLKKKDDAAEAARKAAEEEALRERERRRREKALDGWLHMDSDEEDDNSPMPEIPPPKPRRGVTNAQILEGILGLQVTLASVGETIKESSQISKLLYKPNSDLTQQTAAPTSSFSSGEYWERKREFFEPEFKEHLEIGQTLLSKLEAIAGEIEVDDAIIYTDAQLRQIRARNARILSTAATAVDSSAEKSVSFLFPPGYHASSPPPYSRHGNYTNGTAPSLSSSTTAAFASSSSATNPPPTLPPPLPKSLTSSSSVHYQLINPPPSQDLAQIEKQLQLERRVTALERRLGLHYLKLHDTSTATTIQPVLQQTGSVMGALDRLDHQLEIVGDPLVVRGTMLTEIAEVCSVLKKLIELKRTSVKQIDTMNSGGFGVGSGGRILNSLHRSSRVVSQISGGKVGTIASTNAGATFADGNESGGNIAGGGDGGDDDSPKQNSISDDMAAKIKKRMSTRLQPKLSAPTSQETVISDLKRQTKETETERRVNLLYSRLHGLDTVISQLPYLAVRLQALGNVHEKANELSERLNRLVSEQMKTVDAVRGAEGLARTVEDGLRANEIALMVNFESLETRLIDIVERVQRGY
ncbi:hypothetical protein HK100_011558 [Physocladia obscura]|uniref:Uncharacterized protein n=1 Tax=Physocladia obscura TaxID=109957 RepID=A0AAD5T182_9FUNG|nr:hypothetical protein HK100_011558 [Physocladia obscura]